MDREREKTKAEKQKSWPWIVESELWILWSVFRYINSLTTFTDRVCVFKCVFS